MWGHEGEFEETPTRVSLADWVEVIRAENHEIPGIHPILSSQDLASVAAPPAWKDLVLFLEIECLKHARRQAYIRPN
jgi:hypothetical protein